MPEVLLEVEAMMCPFMGRGTPGVVTVASGDSCTTVEWADEMVNIKSVQKFWSFFETVLANTPSKN